MKNKELGDQAKNGGGGRERERESSSAMDLLSTLFARRKCLSKSILRRSLASATVSTTVHPHEYIYGCREMHSTPPRETKDMWNIKIACIEDISYGQISKRTQYYSIYMLHMSFWVVWLHLFSMNKQIKQSNAIIQHSHHMTTNLSNSEGFFFLARK